MNKTAITLITLSIILAAVADYARWKKNSRNFSNDEMKRILRPDRRPATNQPGKE